MATIRLPDIDDYTLFRSGIIVGLHPSSQPNFGVELSRAAGTSTHSFETVRKIGPNSGEPNVYTDLLPLSTIRYLYRARHVREGYTAGAWTRIVGATPVVVSNVNMDDPIMRPKSMGSSQSVYFKERAAANPTTALLLNAGVDADVQWKTERFDVGGMHNTSSGQRFNCGYTDLYTATATVVFTSAQVPSTSGGVPDTLPFSFTLRKNTVPFVTHEIRVSKPSSGNPPTQYSTAGAFTISGTVDVSSGEYITLHYSAPSGGGLAGNFVISTDSQMEVWRNTL